MKDADQNLAAFADGELDGEHNLEMLERMAQDPSTAQRVADHQKLRRAVAQAMDDPSMKAPAELRERIGQMAQTQQARHVSKPKPAPSTAGPSVLAVLGRWVPSAVAAVLLIGALIALNQTRTPGPDQLITATQVLNPAVADRFVDRHFKCSRNITPLIGTDKLPQNLTALPGALSQYFHQPVNPDVLNLSSLGYQFDMAGLCVIPGKGAIHMIYKSKAPTGQTDTLSLWLRPYQKGSGIKPDKLYKTSKDATENLPMLVWRHGNMVYYLVGDSDDAVERAFDTISRNQS